MESVSFNLLHQDCRGKEDNFPHVGVISLSHCILSVTRLLESPLKMPAETEKACLAFLFCIARNEKWTSIYPTSLRGCWFQFFICNYFLDYFFFSVAPCDTVQVRAINKLVNHSWFWPHDALSQLNLITWLWCSAKSSELTKENCKHVYGNMF